MKFTKKILATITVLSLSSLSALASGVGNGGISVVCRDQSNRIISAQLLDLYEGENQFSRRYDNQLDINSRIDLIKLKLSKHQVFLEEFLEELTKVQSIMRDIPAGYVLMPTNDALPSLRILRRGCALEQLANYTDDDQLLVSQEIYDELANLDRVGLLVHEALYAMFRKSGATDSRQSRRLTAELLASNADQKVIDQILGKHRACGLKGSIEQRIEKCNQSNGLFSLVSRTKEGHEIFKDLKSGLIWSDRLLSSMTHRNSQQACNSDLKEVAGINAAWRLPSKEEYEEAEKNEIRNALPNMNNRFWSSSVHPDYSFAASLFRGENGTTDYDVRSARLHSVRCVAK